MVDSQSGSYGQLCEQANALVEPGLGPTSDIVLISALAFTGFS